MRKLRLTVVSCVLFGAHPLFAREVPAVDARTYRPSPDPQAGAAYEPSGVAEKGEWNLGLAASYSFHPIDLRRDDGGIVARPITHATHFDLSVGAGIGAASFFAVTLPFSFQTGSGNLPDDVVTGNRVPGFAFGDMGLHLKSNLKANPDGGLGIALLGTVFLPTGDKRSFSSERAVRVKTSILFDYSLKLLAIEAGLGVLVRSQEAPAFPGGPSAAFGEELHWSFAASLIPGLFIPAMKARHRWEIGFRGWLPVSPMAPFSSGAAQLSPVLFTLGERASLGQNGDASLLIALDASLNAEAVGAPGIRGIVGFQYAPRVRDQDHDGIPDDRDQCPELAEDKDGKEDNDGCPDVDDDEDAP